MSQFTVTTPTLILKEVMILPKRTEEHETLSDNEQLETNVVTEIRNCLQMKDNRISELEDEVSDLKLLISEKDTKIEQLKKLISDTLSKI